MGILQTNTNQKDEKTIDFSLASSKNLLIIFTRNPELGKGKRRLAAKVGDHAALDIYNFLLAHTVKITSKLYAEKIVYYSDEIWHEDIWDNAIYDKGLQVGQDLGARMLHAFQQGFGRGFEKIVIIGSDMYDLSQDDLEMAFRQLSQNDFVIGPAQDGGYYLLGMKKLKPELFKDKPWGTDTVLAKTLDDLEGEKKVLLDTRNDVDHYEDIKDIPAFAPFLKNIQQ